MRYSLQTWHQSINGSTGLSSHATIDEDTTCQRGVSESRGSSCIGMSGNSSTGRWSREDRTTYTIKMGTRRTTTSAILNSCLPGITRQSTGARSQRSVWRLPDGTWPGLPSRQRSGMGVTRGGSGIGSTRLPVRPSGRSGELDVNIVGRAIGVRNHRSFAPTLASPRSDETTVSMTLSGNVLCVETGSFAIDTEGLKRAVRAAQCGWRTVIAVVPDGVERVFNLETASTHLFTVCGGIVTHNCVDATRYALEPVMKRDQIVYDGYQAAAPMSNKRLGKQPASKTTTTARSGRGTFRGRRGGVL